MKLLQIPTVLLDKRIQEELEINPALEEGDESADQVDTSDTESFLSDELNGGSESDVDDGHDGEAGSDVDDDYVEHDELSGLREDDIELDDYLVNFIEDDPSTYKTRGDENNGDEEEKTVPLAFESTFHEYLEQQLGMLYLTDERERAVARSKKEPGR